MSKCKRRSDTETFKFSNLNPKGQKTGDCVIRAVAAFLGWTWERTYRELAEWGMEHGWMLNSDENFESFLLAKAWEKERMPRRADNTRFTAKEFCQQIAEPGTVYLIRLAHHLSFIGPDCRIWDTWDCGRRSVGNFWSRPI